MKHTGLRSSLIFLLGMLFSVGSYAKAGNYINPVNYAGVTTVDGFLIALVDLVFLIAVPLIVIFIIYSGFLFVTAGNNESQISRARTVFVWTMVGAAVLLGAKAIGAAVQNTINSL